MLLLSTTKKSDIQTNLGKIVCLKILWVSQDDLFKKSGMNAGKKNSNRALHMPWRSHLWYITFLVVAICCNPMWTNTNTALFKRQEICFSFSTWGGHTRISCTKMQLPFPILHFLNRNKDSFNAFFGIQRNQVSWRELEPLPGDLTLLSDDMTEISRMGYWMDFIFNPRIAFQV